MRVYFRNESINKTVDVKVGLHWWGAWIPFFKGTCSFDFLLKELAKGLLVIPWLSMHKRLITELIDNGYKVKTIEGGNHELLEIKLGRSVPKL